MGIAAIYPPNPGPSPLYGGKGETLQTRDHCHFQDNCVGLTNRTGGNAGVHQLLNFGAAQTEQVALETQL